MLGRFIETSITDHRSTFPWSYFSLPELTQSGIINGFMTRSSNRIIIDSFERQHFVNVVGGSSIVIMQQEHGDKVHVIDEGQRPSSGDGIILLEKGVIGVIKTADCIPIILYDVDRPVAAIVHAGWRGTAQRITEKALRRMMDLGARMDRLGAAIGPGIGPCCYRVGPEVIAQFTHAGFSTRIYINKDDVFFLDLKVANREMIEAMGISRIDDIGLCTSCRQDLFYSARNDEGAGRLVNFALLKR